MLRRHAVSIMSIHIMSIHTQDFPFWHTLTLKKKVNMTDLCVYMKQKANGKCIYCINARSSVYDIIINSLYLCIKEETTVDLCGCLQPALIHLFPIGPAASAGPQPAWEWKCLAHVIFGKCRVHRNPGAWSPVSARRPRLAIRLRSKVGGN